MCPKHDSYFPEYEDFESKWHDYCAYEQLNGDMGNSHVFHFEHGDWIVVGHGEKTNSKCGQWRRHDICNRVELHAQADLLGVSHAGEVYVHMVHTWCHSYACHICYLKGACLREAEHISQRVEKASEGGKDGKGISMRLWVSMSTLLFLLPSLIIIWLSLSMKNGAKSGA
jgi:hypothetical protein